MGFAINLIAYFHFQLILVSFFLSFIVKLVGAKVKKMISKPMDDYLFSFIYFCYRSVNS